MQSFPVLDDKARKEAEKEREILMKKLRKSQREYNGPPLILESAKKAENDRLDALQKVFNRASARRSRVRKMANIKYLGWANRKLEKMYEKSKVDLVHEDFNHFQLRESIAEAEENNRKLQKLAKTTKNDQQQKNNKEHDKNNKQTQKQQKSEESRPDLF